MLGITYAGWSQPVMVGAEYIHNLGAEIDDDSGHALGLSVGRGRKKSEWRAYYQYQLVEQDAVFSAFAQDDFLLATNARSHVAGLHYRLDDRIDLHLWTLVSSREETFPGIPTADSDDPQWRVRLDLSVEL